MVMSTHRHIGFTASNSNVAIANAVSVSNASSWFMPLNTSLFEYNREVQNNNTITNAGNEKHSYSNICSNLKKILWW